MRIRRSSNISLGKFAAMMIRSRRTEELRCARSRESEVITRAGKSGGLAGVG